MGLGERVRRLEGGSGHTCPACGRSLSEPDTLTDLALLVQRGESACERCCPESLRALAERVKARLVERTSVVARCRGRSRDSR